MTPVAPPPRVDWGLTRGRDRALDDAIVSLAARGEKVLDLGCGAGDLLLRLKREKCVRERGIEQESAAVMEGIARGLSIVEGDLVEGLHDMSEASCDLVVLNQVLPLVTDPVGILREALRVGTRAIVTYPNFAHWRVRLSIAARGRLPVTPSLPYAWYDTPNIRLVTVRDFRELCRRLGWRLREEVFAEVDGNGRARRVRALPNLRASLALAVLEGAGAAAALRPPGAVIDGSASRH